MATYYVDDGGNGTDGTSWANAYTSFTALKVAHATFAEGDIVYVGADSVGTEAGNLTLVGPTDSIPVRIISATVGTTTYAKGTANQIDMSGGSRYLIFDGSFAVYGLKINCGNSVFLYADVNEEQYWEDYTILLEDGGSLNLEPYSTDVGGYYELVNGIIDGGNDTGSASVIYASDSVKSKIVIRGLLLLNMENRDSDSIFYFANNNDDIEIHGVDALSCTATPGVFWFSGWTSRCEVSHVIKDAAIPLLTNGTSNYTNTTAARVMATHYSSATDDQWSIRKVDMRGDLEGTNAVYRTGGAEINATPYSWQILVTPTASYVSAGTPFRTPWIYDEIAAAGSLTFALHVVNDTADLTDVEIWLEVEYKPTADSPLWAVASDRQIVTANAVAQTDDTTSTWNGTGPSFTYKQTLSVSATVGQAGEYRSRVCVAKAGLADTDYLYIDPVVTVS